MKGTRAESHSPGGMPMRARRRRRTSIIRKVCFGVVASVILIMSALCGYLQTTPLGAFRLLGKGAGFLADHAMNTPPFEGRSQVNIVVFGVDSSFVSEGPPRTDTIKLVSINVDKPGIGILSIPRDTWVEQPGYRPGKINGAYQRGGQDDQACIEHAREAVSCLLQELYGHVIPIDYYVRIQTGGFKQIVDALGGVTIDVEKQMDYDDNYQNLHIHLKPGRQLLNGTEAMGYVRFRHDVDGDFGRMERQDNFIRALVDELQQPGAESRALALLPAICDEKRFLKTDLRLNDIKAIKRIATTLGMDGIFAVQLPTVPDWKGKASIVEVKDRVAAQQAIIDVLHGPRPTVTVLNGSGRRRLGREASEQIDGLAYNVVAVGTLPEPVPVSEIYTHQRYTQAARALAMQFGVKEIDTESPVPPADFGARESESPASAITLVLGQDYTVQRQARLE